MSPFVFSIVLEDLTKTLEKKRNKRLSKWKGRIKSLCREHDVICLQQSLKSLQTNFKTNKLSKVVKYTNNTQATEFCNLTVKDLKKEIQVKILFKITWKNKIQPTSYPRWLKK